MYALDQGIEGPLMEYANKKYRSHRRIPQEVDIAALKAEFDQYEIKKKQRK